MFVYYKVLKEKFCAHYEFICVIQEITAFLYNQSIFSTKSIDLSTISNHHTSTIHRQNPSEYATWHQHGHKGRDDDDAIQFRRRMHASVAENFSCTTSHNRSIDPYRRSDFARSRNDPIELALARRFSKSRVWSRFLFGSEMMNDGSATVVEECPWIVGYCEGGKKVDGYLQYYF